MCFPPARRWVRYIGKTLLRNHGSDLFYKMRAYAAAASDQVTEVINPKETRAKIALALRTMLSKREVRPAKKHGNMPL